MRHESSLNFKLTPVPQGQNIQISPAKGNALFLDIDCLKTGRKEVVTGRSGRENGLGTPTPLPRREGANDRGRMKLISGVLERF